MRVIVAYIPVLHRGYMDFLIKHQGPGCTLLLVGEEMLAKFEHFDYIKRKDAIRALPSHFVKVAIMSWKKDLDYDWIGVLNEVLISRLQNEKNIQLVMPSEDIMREIAKFYFPDREICFDSVFLRWNRDNVQEKKSVEVHRSLSDTLEKDIIDNVLLEAQKSADWWRQVGAAVIKEEKVILLAHNTHIPHEQMPYAFGDPRSIFKKGICIELSTAGHAESILISTAAREGISLKETCLYVTDFPCPPCAKLVANTGIKRLYFSRGYAVLDGESILKEKGIEIVFVDE